MKLQDALKYNGHAIGCIKCTFARIYPEPELGSAIFSIRKDWIKQNISGGDIYFTNDQLAEIAAIYPSEDIYYNNQAYEDGELVSIYLSSIVSTNADMSSDDRFQAVYLLSDAIKAVDKAMEHTINNWQLRIAAFDRSVAGWNVAEEDGAIKYWYTENPSWIKWKEQYDKTPPDLRNALPPEPEKYLVKKRPHWYDDFQWELSRYKEVIEQLQMQADSGIPMYVHQGAIEWYPDMSIDTDGQSRVNPYEQAYINAYEAESRLRNLLIAAGMSSLL